MQAQFEYNGFRVHLVDPALIQSDGVESTHPPPTSNLRPLDPSHPSVIAWLDKLTVFPQDLAMEVSTLTSDAGIGIRCFPSGYRLFEQKRLGAGGRTDLYLYGHPSGARFRSAREFQPHWLWLWLPRGDGEEGCPCNLCTGVGRRR